MDPAELPAERHSCRGVLTMNTHRLSLVFLVASSPAFSQVVRARPAVADSSVVRIMARVGQHGGAAWLQDVLRQTNDPHDSPAKLDEIADSLVGRATDPRQARADSPAHMMASEAVGTLVMASVNGVPGGHAYRGSLERLILVHRRAPASDVRARALGGLLSLASPRARAIAYLRNVAESTDPTAHNAMGFLIEDANGGGAVLPTAAQQQESVAALKAMAAANRVTDRKALELLGGWLATTQPHKPN